MRPGEDELRRFYESDGLNCAEIGRQFGVNRTTVRRWLVAEGIEVRFRPNEKYPGDAEMQRLYVDEKKSLRQIALELDTFMPVVSRWLKRAGIQSRSISEGTVLSGKYGVQNEAHRESLRKNAYKARAHITKESRKKQGAKMVGKSPANKGKPMSEEQRQKLVERWQDPERREKMAALRRGEKSHLWKGGKTPDSSLHGWEWRELRKQVYERDAWLCQDCGAKCLNTADSKTKPKLKIQAHHVIPRRYGGTDELANLVTLCMSCHHKRERAFKHADGAAA